MGSSLETANKRLAAILSKMILTAAYLGYANTSDLRRVKLC
jgi:hypothetical protein